MANNTPDKEMCLRCGNEIKTQSDECNNCIFETCQVNWNGEKAETLCPPCQHRICNGHGVGTTPEQRSNMRAYRLPLYERYMEISESSRGYGFRPHLIECRHVDEVGLFIYHDGKQELTDDLIRHYLPVKQKTNCIILASSVTEAIQRFYRDWEGANIGGSAPNTKALWIDRSEDRLNQEGQVLYPIEELPSCVYIHMNSEDRPTCGRPIQDIQDHPDRDEKYTNKDGEFGMCGLDDVGFPEEIDCPMAEYGRYASHLPHHTVTVNELTFEYTTSDDITDLKRTIARKETLRKKEEKMMRFSTFRRLREVTL